MQEKDKPVRRSKLAIERRRQNLSQEELAAKLGVSPITVSRWERGISFPDSYACQRLCEVFGKESIEELGFELADTEIVEGQDTIQALSKAEQREDEHDSDLVSHQDIELHRNTSQSEQRFEQLSQQAIQTNIEYSVTHSVGQNSVVSLAELVPLIGKIQALLHQMMAQENKPVSRENELKNAYLQLLTVSEARLEFASIVEAIRTYNGEIANERLPQVKAELVNAEQAFNEKEVRHTLLLFDNNKVWFHYRKATMAFEGYIERTKEIVEQALKPRSPLTVLVMRYDVLLNPSLDDDPRTRKIYTEICNELTLMQKAMNKRLRL